jgi:hypothetical protein
MTLVTDWSDYRGPDSQTVISVRIACDRTGTTPEVGWATPVFKVNTGVADDTIEAPLVACDFAV